MTPFTAITLLVKLAFKSMFKALDSRHTLYVITQFLPSFKPASHKLRTFRSVSLVCTYSLLTCLGRGMRMSITAHYLAAMLKTGISQTRILRVELPGELPGFWRSSPLQNKVLIESNPWTWRILVRKTGGQGTRSFRAASSRLSKPY